MAELDGTDDYFDSRDVISRIDEFQDEYLVDAGDSYEVDTSAMTEDEREEYEALVELQEEAEVHISDWIHGGLFIADSYFEEYAEDYARDTGAISDGDGWPLNRIDWAAAADDLKQDYTSFEFRGTTYWAR